MIDLLKSSKFLSIIPMGGLWISYKEHWILLTLVNKKKNSFKDESTFLISLIRLESSVI